MKAAKTQKSTCDWCPPLTHWKNLKILCNSTYDKAQHILINVYSLRGNERNYTGCRILLERLT